MSKKLKIILIVIIAISTIVTANIVGYAVWTMNQPPVTETTTGDFNSDEYYELTGVTINSTKQLQMGIFFYEEDNSNTEEGVLEFEITFDRNNMPEVIQNSEFTLIASVSLSTKYYDTNNDIINIISGSTFESVSANSTDISNDAQISNNTIIVNVDISSSDTSLTLDYVFKQNLLQYRDLILNDTFDITLSYIKEGN